MNLETEPQAPGTLSRTLSTAVPPSTQAPLVESSPAMPTRERGPLQLCAFPTELVVMIFSDPILTSADQLVAAQASKRLRDIVAFISPIPLLILDKCRADGKPISCLRRIFFSGLHSIAETQTMLAVCQPCMTIHNMGLGPKYKLPPCFAKARRKLLVSSPTIPETHCKWDVIKASSRLKGPSMLPTEHTFVQLALKYTNMQLEDPHALEGITVYDRKMLEWALQPALQYSSEPMPISTPSVKAFCAQYPRVMKNEHGELRYVVKSQYLLRSCRWSTPVPKKLQAPEDKAYGKHELDRHLLPLRSSDVVYLGLCPHQIISPQQGYENERADKEDEVQERPSVGHGKLVAAVERGWCRTKYHTLRRFPQPKSEQEPRPELRANFDMNFDFLDSSSYANDLVHEALGDPSPEQLGACCPLCPTYVFVGTRDGGRELWIYTWRDFGPYSGPSNYTWQQHVLGSNLFYGTPQDNLEDRPMNWQPHYNLNSGDEGIAFFQREQDYSAWSLYEGAELKQPAFSKLQMYKEHLKTKSLRLMSMVPRLALHNLAVIQGIERI